MPEPQLFVIGAGHVGTAVADLAHWLGFRTVVWDDREELAAEAATSSNVDAAVDGPITNLVDSHPVRVTDSIVIVTRNVGLDLEILPVLLQTPAGYIGLMGSNRRWSTTQEKLVSAGLLPTDLERINAPIGVEIAAETPAEIAVSIMAEVIANRRGPNVAPGSHDRLELYSCGAAETSPLVWSGGSPVSVGPWW